MTHQTTGDYFRSTTWIYQPETSGRKLQVFLENYKQFFSWSFLFAHGDPLTRHSVGQHGELHRSFLPLIALGFLAMLVRPRRVNLIPLMWMIFGVGPGAEVLPR